MDETISDDDNRNPGTRDNGYKATFREMGNIKAASREHTTYCHRQLTACPSDEQMTVRV